MFQFLTIFNSLAVVVFVIDIVLKWIDDLPGIVLSLTIRFLEGRLERCRFHYHIYQRATLLITRDARNYRFDQNKRRFEDPTNSQKYEIGYLFQLFKDDCPLHH